MSSPIALLLGAGARVGAATSSTFLSAGYRVARVSRSQNPSEDTSTLLNIPADLSQPDSVEKIFGTVRQKFGEPSVVIYNGKHQTQYKEYVANRSQAYGAHMTAGGMSNPTDTFAIPTADFAAAQTINITSSFVAMREALTSFQSSSAAKGPKTFIFTGNIMNQGTLPGLLALGAGKAGAAWMVECAYSIFTKSSNDDIRFFYADERHEDGTPLFTGLGGQGHADAFLGLAERREGWTGLGWLTTFVSGDEKAATRYKEFRRGLILPEGM